MRCDCSKQWRWNIDDDRFLFFSGRGISRPHPISCSNQNLGHVYPFHLFGGLDVVRSLYVVARTTWYIRCPRGTIYNSNPTTNTNCYTTTRLQHHYLLRRCQHSMS